MASALVATNFSASITPSRAVSFFRSTPRWPSATNSFELSYSYLTPVALTALIPLLVALVLLLALLLLTTTRYTCRERPVDARILRLHRSPRGTLLQIGLAAALSALVFLFIAMGIVSVTAVNFAAHDVLDLIRGLVLDLSRTGFAFVDVALLVERRLGAFSPADLVPDPSGPVPVPLLDQFVPALKSVQDYMLSVYPDVAPLVTELNAVVTDIFDLIEVLRKATSIASGVLVSICLLLLLAPVLLFFLDAMPLSKRTRPWRLFVHILIVIFPTLLTWAMVGLTSAVGAVVADACTTVHDYRSVLLGDFPATDFPSNALLDVSSGCPDVNPARISEQFNSTIQSVLQSDLAKESINLLLDIPAPTIAETAEWTRDEIIKYVDCSTLIAFSGQLEYIVCAAQGKSAAEGVYDLFISFMGLAMVLIVAVLLSLFGLRVAWSLLVWPRENLESDMTLDNLSPQQRNNLSMKNEIHLEENFKY